ncbi:ATP-dependent Clp protease ATP-binding subunit [Candidatus Saccharibacteria bacterium]|nr:ATP-dependent Clp protease ATP-binding subunit [Candidatus Saccharibacteria bacterium]
MLAHPRWQQARFANRFNIPLTKALLVLISVTLLLGGVILGLMGVNIGWFLASLASPFIMMILWLQRGLTDISTGSGQTLADLLDSRILGKLDAEPSPSRLAEAVMQTSGGLFFAGRFGIGPNFLASLTSSNPADTGDVWRVALSLHGSRPGPVLGSELVVALVRSIPNVETVLAQLQLDLDDIEAGMHWHRHIQDLIAYHNRPKRTGGIARDWSFGYTPLLSRFGTNISEQIAHGALLNVDLESHDAARAQIVQLFTHSGRQNAALVGPLGVGKTTIVEAFAAHLLEAGSHNLPASLRYRQVISLDASALISHAPGRGELEQLVHEILVEAFRAKNVILCLDNAQLFFEEGTGSVDISNVLLPVLEGGAVRVILTMDEHRWLQIGQRTPALATALNRIVIESPTREETMRVLQDQLIPIEYHNRITYMFQALTESYRLSERYINEQAMPGKALKLLTSAAHYAEGGIVSAVSVQKAIEQTTGIKVSNVNTHEERDRLLNMENLIHERMINQTRAVKVVSDALRRARAGVRNQDRPIGTFLFLGPTGVGKTELSKALSEVYFNGESKLVRLDLNEYSQPGDVSRLIADAAQDPHSLTAQVSKQPFSVVLLDEIEKAHPSVLNALLQVLDEGILRDINNRDVSFRDSIIIATSNAGADMIRNALKAGYTMEQVETTFVNELINQKAFKPEFLNRFDEIVLFRPLNQEELLQVIDLILKGINKNLALQKIAVEVSEDARRLLVEKGYDPRLGARPMRRMVSRSVENLVAKQMLSGSVMAGQTITLTRDDIVASLEQQGELQSGAKPALPATTDAGAGGE